MLSKPVQRPVTITIAASDRLQPLRVGSMGFGRRHVQKEQSHGMATFPGSLQRRHGRNLCAIITTRPGCKRDVRLCYQRFPLPLDLGLCSQGEHVPVHIVEGLLNDGKLELG